MLNTICLMGRLVHDPEMKKTASDKSVVTFAIAVERNRADQSGNRPVDYIDVVCWQNTAEFVCQYFRKGNMIAVNGRLETRTYEDKDGKKRKVFEVVADNVHFCGSKQESNTGGNSQVETGFSEIEDNEDDLPF